MLRVGRTGTDQEHHFGCEWLARTRICQTYTNLQSDCYVSPDSQQCCHNKIVFLLLLSPIICLKYTADEFDFRAAGTHIGRVSCRVNAWSWKLGQGWREVIPALIHPFLGKALRARNAMIVFKMLIENSLCHERGLCKAIFMFIHRFNVPTS